MKKNYFEPEIELIDIELASLICVSGAEGGDGDGSSDITTTDPTDPGWGSDY